MVNSYYGVYQAERGKTTGEIRAAGRVPGRTGRRMRAGPSPLTRVPWPPEERGTRDDGTDAVARCHRRLAGH